MSSTAFITTERALHLKRWNFAKEIKEILDVSVTEIGLNKTAFEDKKVYFNEHWEDIVASTEDCFNMIDYDKDEQITELNYHIELLKGQFKQVLDLEVEIERKSSNVEKKMSSFQDLSPR